MIISDELFFNVVKDWEKKTISNEEKGLFIKAFMTEKNLSERKVAEIIGVPRSTVNDWISNRQMKKYYKGKRNELNVLLDRLVFVLSKREYALDDKSKYLLSVLRGELDKVVLV